MEGVQEGTLNRRSALGNVMQFQINSTVWLIMKYPWWFLHLDKLTMKKGKMGTIRETGRRVYEYILPVFATSQLI